MIITRTPLRISFAGGGTDLPAYYREETGAVLSATITAYMRVLVNPKFDGTIRLGYSRTENVGTVEDLQHDIARETLKYCDVERGVEVVSVADVPAGTGLGSSSSYTVGLLNALYGSYGHMLDAETLARHACEIEIEKCGHPIGRQDQYAAAFGGLRLYEFYADGVKVNPALDATELEKHLMLFYLGTQRDANGLLKEQPLDRAIYRDMATLAHVLSALARAGEWHGFAREMDAAWQLKRRVAQVSPAVDAALTLAKHYGALAGKLCGAGGTGFLLLFVPPECQTGVRAALNLRELLFRFESHGSQVIYAD